VKEAALGCPQHKEKTLSVRLTHAIKYLHCPLLHRTAEVGSGSFASQIVRSLSGHSGHQDESTRREVPQPEVSRRAKGAHGIRSLRAQWCKRRWPEPQCRGLGVCERALQLTSSLPLIGDLLEQPEVL
jgi:hypothetical protein